jgi:hypothetical protein
MTYTFARVGAVVALNMEDYHAQKKRRWLHLKKTANSNEIRCHHELESFLGAYIAAARVERDRKSRFFRAALGKTKKARSRGACRASMFGRPRRRGRRRARDANRLPHLSGDGH